MRIEADDFPAQLLLEPRHHRNHQNQNHDPQSHAENGNQGDDRKKGALRLKVAHRKKQAETLRHLQDFLHAPAEAGNNFLQSIAQGPGGTCLSGPERCPQTRRFGADKQRPPRRMNSTTNSACESLPAKATDPDFYAAQRAPGSAAHIPSDHRNVHARAFAGPNVLFAKSVAPADQANFLRHALSIFSSRDPSVVRSSLLVNRKNGCDRAGKCSVRQPNFRRHSKRTRLLPENSFCPKSAFFQRNKPSRAKQLNATGLC